MSKLSKNLSGLILLCLAGGAIAAAPRAIPLQAGTYILDGAGKTCADVPNAGTRYFDGKNMLGPHEEPCTSSVKSVSKDGHVYTISNACAGQMMDGSKVAETQTIKLKITGKASYQDLAGNGSFHRCGPYSHG